MRRLALALTSATLPASADTITAGSKLMVFGNIENDLSTGVIEFYSGQQLPAIGTGDFSPFNANVHSLNWNWQDFDVHWWDLGPGFGFVAISNGGLPDV
jgi:hypothetical protein